MIVFENENEIWSARDPDVPGVFGIGSSREAALEDYAAAKATMEAYLARKTAVEDAEDVYAADKSRKEIIAGGVLLTQEEVDARFKL